METADALIRFGPLVLCAGAALTDLRIWKISNLWLALWLAGGILAAVSGRTVPVPECVTGAVLPLILLGWLFVFHMMGAGDIKLFCTLGVWLGGGILTCMLVSFLAAAVFAVVRMLLGRNTRERFRKLKKYAAGFLKSGVRVSYEAKNAGKARLHLAVPVLIAVVLKLLGVYA